MIAIDLVTIEVGTYLVVRASLGRHRLAAARVTPVCCPCCLLPSGYAVRLKAATTHTRLLRRAVKTLVGELSEQFPVLRWEAAEADVQDSLRALGYRAVGRAGTALAFGRIEP